MTPDRNETAPAQGQKDTRTLYIDYSKCIGCETCEAVCKFLYSQPRIVMVRTVDGQMLPLYCRHCDHPHCMKTCRTGSLTIDEQNAVLLNPMFCRGCQTKSCILGCPYGGVFATGEGVAVSKCDLCASRRKKRRLARLRGNVPHWSYLLCRAGRHSRPGNGRKPRRRSTSDGLCAPAQGKELGK